MYEEIICTLYYTLAYTPLDEHVNIALIAFLWIILYT